MLRGYCFWKCCCSCLVELQQFYFYCFNRREVFEKKILKDSQKTVLFSLDKKGEVFLKEEFHELKILPQYFWACKTGHKCFEIRKNDRDFKVGDLIQLREYKDGSYTGRCVLGRISFITDYQQQDDYVVLNFKRLRLDEAV